MSERERALHRDIMNLQMKPTPITLRLGYREGFMDARRAAAELVASLPPASSPDRSDAYEDDEPSSVAEGTLDAWSAPLRRPVTPKILTTDDFYALLRILEVLPIADPFLTALQFKLSDEERRQQGNQASHLSGPEFVREIERIEALIQSRMVPPASSPQTCPHCHLPSVVPDVCTPELHAVIEERIAEDWALLNRGIAIGQSFQQPPASSPQTCAWRVDRSGSWTNGCAAEGRPQGFYRSVNHLWSHCHFCGGELLLTPAEEPK